MNNINERLKLESIDSYEPLYKDFLQALEVNPSINILGLYKSEIEEGLFIKAEVIISIPTGGVYNNLDIRNKEVILFFLNSEYPLNAPVIIVVRDDFPYSFIPHLNMGVSKSQIDEFNLCLYRGNIDEWFYEHGSMAFCDLVNEWFSDLVNGTLIKKDGFECVRINNSKGVMVADYEALEQKIAENTREKGHYILSLSLSGNFYFKVINENYKANSSHLPCLLVFDKRVNPEYVSDNLRVVSDLKKFYSYQGLNHAIQKYRSTYYNANSKNSLLNEGIFIIIAVKRPQQVIGSFGEFEFLAFWLEFDFLQNPYVDNCEMKNLLALQSLNCKITERLSGTQFKKENIVVWGCGALGSKVSLEMARMGYLTQKLYDNDILLPHNLVRHEIASQNAIGLNKANALKLEIESMYDDAKISVVDNNSFFCEDIFEEEIVIDCTASERNLNWSCMSNRIKNRFIRCEIFMKGKLEGIFIEGRNRNPDAYDMRVFLWYKAMENEIIKIWLNQKNEENIEFHIGFGCSSDTMVLDDATINNHASIVPHCINKYSQIDDGTLVINYFDKDELQNNFIKIFEIEKYISWKTEDDWVIHCPYEIVQRLSKIACDQTENMGIWFGNINGRMKRITIADIYIPKDNVRSGGNVTGGIEGVDEKIREVVRNTGGMINYIGEWHTHPNGLAVPSETDYRAFNTVTKNSKPFLMSIITCNDVGNWVLT